MTNYFDSGEKRGYNEKQCQFFQREKCRAYDSLRYCTIMYVLSMNRIKHDRAYRIGPRAVHGPETGTYDAHIESNVDFVLDI